MVLVWFWFGSSGDPRGEGVTTITYHDDSRYWGSPLIVADAEESSTELGVVMPEYKHSDVAPSSTNELAWDAMKCEGMDKVGNEFAGVDKVGSENLRGNARGWIR